MTGGGIRAARNLSAAAVATIAAWSSYYHMVHVALHYGERPEVAYGLPFSVDGMLVVATIVMVDDKHRTHRVRPMARLAFTAGVIASIAANIAAAHPSVGARIIDGWPALALLLVVEMLARPPAAEIPTPDPCTDRSPAEGIRAVRSAAAEPPQVLRTPMGTSAAASPAEVPTSAYIPTHDAEARIPARDAAVAYGRDDGAGRTVPRDLEAPAGSNRHLRLAGAALPVVQHSARTSTNTHPSAIQHSPAVGGATRTAGTAASSALGIGAAGATAELPPWIPPAATVRPEVPAAAPTLIAAEHPPAEPGPVEVPPAEHDLTAPTGSRPAEPTGAGHGATTRRPTAITRRMAHTIMAAEPHLSRTELANRLGVSTRRLREVLAA